MKAHAGVAAIVGVAMALQVFNTVDVVGPASAADLGLLIAGLAVVLYQAITLDGYVAAGARPLALLMGALIAWLATAGEGLLLTQFLGFGAIFAVLVFSVRSTGDMEVVLGGLFVGAIAASLLTMYSAFVDPACCGRTVTSRFPAPLDIPRTMGVWGTGSFAAFGTYLLAPLPYAMLKWRRTRSLPLAAGIVAICVALVILQTRAVFLGAVAMIGVLALARSARWAWTVGWRYAGVSLLAVGHLGVGGLAAALALYLINPETVAVRLNQYRTAVELIISHPIVGVTPPLIQYFPTENVPHNVVLYLGVLAGVPAVVLFCCLVAVAVAGCVDGARHAGGDLPVGILAGLVGALTAVSFSVGFGRVIWVLIALGVMLIGYQKGQIPMLEWAPTATRNSKLIRGIRRCVRGSSIWALLTYDATPVRKRIERAWRRSGVRRAGYSVGRAAKESVVCGWLFGRR